MVLVAPTQLCLLRGGVAQRRVRAVSETARPVRLATTRCSAENGTAPVVAAGGTAPQAAVGGTRRRSPRAVSVVAAPVEEAPIAAQQSTDADRVGEAPEQSRRYEADTSSQRLQGRAGLHSSHGTRPKRRRSNHLAVFACSALSFEITMPPTKVEGLQEDCTGLTIEVREGTLTGRICCPELLSQELCTSDAVYNHEINWLSFNWRVIAMAMDPSTPLFERLRFISIAARNLDEYFAKRVGALKRQEAAGVENLLKKRDKSIWTPEEQLRLISQGVNEMDEAIAQTLLGDVLPKLRSAGVFLLDYDELNKTERDELREWFMEKVEPLLTPLAVDPGHPFPFIASLTLSIAVELMDEYADDHLGAGGLERHTHFAIVTVPSGLARWKRLSGRGANAFVPVEQVRA